MVVRLLHVVGLHRHLLSSLRAPLSSAHVRPAVLRNDLSRSADHADKQEDPVFAHHRSGSAKRWRPRTPAMAAGLTDHVWTLRDVLLFRVPPWP
jgi:hypothetical protein